MPGEMKKCDKCGFRIFTGTLCDRCIIENLKTELKAKAEEIERLKERNKHLAEACQAAVEKLCSDKRRDDFTKAIEQVIEKENPNE